MRGRSSSADRAQYMFAVRQGLERPLIDSPRMTASAESLTDAGAVQGRVPDFFIVGHHKSGTTALYEMLRRHPEIYMPALKEPRFLASDMRARFPAARGRALPQTLDEYRSLFAGASPQQRAGEATPSYLFSHTAAARIANSSRTRVSSRSCASPRASCTHCTCSCCAVTSSRRRACAARCHSRPLGVRASASRAARTCRSCCSTQSTCATSSSCAATTRCSRPSRCSC